MSSNFNNINDATNSNANYPGNEFVPTSFNAPLHQGGRSQPHGAMMRDETGVEPQSYINPAGTDLHTEPRTGAGFSRGPEYASGPTGGNVDTFGTGVLPSGAGTIGGMGKHEHTTRHADPTKPSLSDKMRGQAEILAGKVANNPEMVGKGEERKAGNMPSNR